MCRECVSAYMRAEGIDTLELSPDQLALARRIDAFHDLEGCGAGGPLHLVVDDQNVEDEHIAWSMGQDRSGYPPEVWIEAEAIAAALLAMPSLAERAAVTL